MSTIYLDYMPYMSNMAKYLTYINREGAKKARGLPGFSCEGRRFYFFAGGARRALAWAAQDVSG